MARSDGSYTTIGKALHVTAAGSHWAISDLKAIRIISPKSGDEACILRNAMVAVLSTYTPEHVVRANYNPVRQFIELQLKSGLTATLAMVPTPENSIGHLFDIKATDGCAVVADIARLCIPPLNLTHRTDAVKAASGLVGLALRNSYMRMCVTDCDDGTIEVLLHNGDTIQLKLKGDAIAQASTTSEGCLSDNDQF